MFKMLVNLPYAGNIRVPEFTNKDIFTIIKYCTAEDLEGFNNYMEEILFSNLPRLNIIDKAFLLLSLRAAYIDDKVEVKIVDDNVPYMKFSVSKMADRVRSLPFIEKTSMVCDNIVVELELPTSLYTETLDDIIYNCIVSLTLDDTVIIMNTLTSAEKSAVYEALPPRITPMLIEYFKNVVKKLQPITFIESYPQYKLEKVEVSPISNQILMYIMSLFNQDLLGYLEYMFNYVNKVGGTFGDFLNLTFNDTRIIIDFYRTEIENQNESLKTKK